MKTSFRKVASTGLLAGVLLANTASADTLKLAFMDPMSGPFGVIGENFLKTFQVYVDAANKNNWAGEHDFEIKGFDNKAKVQDTLMQFRTIVDEGYRVVIQGNSSAAGLALTDAIEKHNRRNPDDPMVYINYSNGDPSMTNEKCSYWHFATSINLDMKLDAMTSMIAADDSIKKVYLINQDYSMGHQVSRLIKKGLQAKNPDIEIVGDVLHPIGRVRDFAPYASEIRRANPDIVVTGNWGNDFGQLAEASQNAGVEASFYAIYGAATGGPSAITDGWDEQVLTLSNWNPNGDDFIGEEYVEAVNARHPEDDLYYMQPDTYNAVKLLATAIRDVGSVDLNEFVPAMSGLSFTGMNGDELQMRVDDHQLQSPLWSVVWSSVENNDIALEQDGTGHGWLAQEKLPISETTTPTTCEMKRP